MEGHFIIARDDAPFTSSTGKIIKAEAYLKCGIIADTLSAAQKKARRIIKNAQTAIEDEKAKGYTQGFEQGLSDGQEKIVAEVLDAVAKAQSYLDSVEDLIADTVIEALEKIIGEIGEYYVFKQLVVKTVKSVRNKKDLVLRVAPQQIKYAQDALNALDDDADRVAILPDGRLNDGDCVLESPISSVNAGLDKQLEILKKTLKARFALYGKVERSES